MLSCHWSNLSGSEPMKNIPLAWIPKEKVKLNQVSTTNTHTNLHHGKRKSGCVSCQKRGLAEWSILLVSRAPVNTFQRRKSNDWVILFEFLPFSPFVSLPSYRNFFFVLINSGTWKVDKRIYDKAAVCMHNGVSLLQQQTYPQ